MISQLWATLPGADNFSMLDQKMGVIELIVAASEAI